MFRHRCTPRAEVPYTLWAFLFAVAITLVNVRGVEMTARASQVMTVFMVAATVLFVAGCVRFIVNSAGLSGLFVSDVVVNPRTLQLSPLMLGAGVATLSYLGFDAISTLAEETTRKKTSASPQLLFVCCKRYSASSSCTLRLWFGHRRSRSLMSRPPFSTLHKSPAADFFSASRRLSCLLPASPVPLPARQEPQGYSLEWDGMGCCRAASSLTSIPPTPPRREAFT